MPDLKEKINKLVDDFARAVDEVEKNVEGKDSNAYKNFINYDNSYFSIKNTKSSENKVDFPKGNTKKESVLGKIADYKEKEKSVTKPKIEKSKDMGVEI